MGSSLDWDQMVAAAEAAGVSTKSVENERKPVPADRYVAKIRDAKATKASTGAEMIKVTFEIVAGPHANRYIWNNIVLPQKEEHAKYFANKLAAMGIPLGWVRAQRLPLADLAARMVGRHVEIVVTEGTDNRGKPNNDVRFINAARASDLQRLGLPQNVDPSKGAAPAAAPSVPAPGANAAPTPPAPPAPPTPGSSSPTDEDSLPF